MTAHTLTRARKGQGKKAGGNGKMGRFHVDLEVANNKDMVLAESGHLDKAKVRRVWNPGVVDTGSVSLVLPKSVVEQLGLAETGTVNVRYADRRRAKRATVQNVWLKLLGREQIFGAIVEPKRQDALIGAVVMEQLDLLVDPVTQKLIPRDPRGIVAEIE